ncbi:3-deoxy-D-manno-octulosonic acid transferase [Flavisolibacter ginsengisoli]|jgi:3-deoxy-D-manno-octulosonic-acid transferase|nr:glycosyltransferase N-terminal domain-containing protein [Flavisolibacter ginsengisoli]
MIRLYVLGIRLASLRSKKAKEWLQGRKDLYRELQENIKKTDRVIWMHCSSAGEFEQGKPIISGLNKQYPGHKIVVTFFSPSGYQVAKKTAAAHYVTYLPVDTRANARQFINTLHPELIIFVKYEFWIHHLSEAASRHIPLLLVSAVFRKDQAFFKWYGQFYKKVLMLFQHLFVQDKASFQLLKENNITHCSISGDTRFDRVREIADNFSDLPVINNFVGNDRVVVAGSTWKEDEKMLSGYMPVKLILAPHEIDEEHISEVEALFTNSIRYSNYEKRTGKEMVLIIDNVGMLSRLYKYATIAYIGGGFTRDGIHNILEAAVYGKSVIFGPNYHKYREAKELIAAGGAFSVRDKEQWRKRVDSFLENETYLQSAGLHALHYITKNTGGTAEVLHYIQANRLLTR